MRPADVDRLLRYRVGSAARCPGCATVWAPTPTRRMAYPIEGPRAPDRLPVEMRPAGHGAWYAYCGCGTQVVWDE